MIVVHGWIVDRLRDRSGHFKNFGRFKNIPWSSK